MDHTTITRLQETIVQIKDAKGSLVRALAEARPKTEEDYDLLFSLGQNLEIQLENLLVHNAALFERIEGMEEDK